jgi:very-short-patch-repair endonuclease
MIKRCEICKKEFKSCPAAKRRFCSRKCYGINNQGANNPHYGIPQPEYVKEIISKTNKGRITPGFKGHTHSEESKKKIAINTKISLENSINPRKKNIFWIGRKHREESKEKISKTRKIRIKEGKIVHITPMKDTSIEIKIQNFLKELKIDFFTHYHMNIEHYYRCDIFIPSLNLVIECDGDYWHKYPIGNDLDHIRTKELIEKGFKVLRLWGDDIKKMDIVTFQEKLHG